MKETKQKRWKIASSSVFNLGYYLEWCSKYRRKVLPGKVEGRLKQLLSEKAGELNKVIYPSASMEKGNGSKGEMLLRRWLPEPHKHP